MAASGWRAATLVLGAFVCLPLAAARAEPAAIVDFNALQGQVVYLDFWASWCAPCRQSFPWMEAMRKAHQSQGLTVIAVNVDHDRPDAERFLKQFKPGFEVRFDPDGLLAQRFNVTGMPTSVILDRGGKVRYTHIGFWSAQGATAEQEMALLLAEPAGVSK